MYRVLIVDDEPIAIASVEYIIQNNFDNMDIVGKAKSGRDAIEKALLNRPDIIIMDINMPGINGLEAMRQIKERNKEVRFIVASAFDYFEYAVEAVALSVDEYLLKPLKEAKLIEALKKVVHEIDRRRQSVSKELELKEKFEMIIPVLETGFINSLCMFEDNQEELESYCRLFDYAHTGGFVIVIEFGEKVSGEITNKIGAGIKSQKLYINFRDILKASCKCIVGPMMLNRLIIYVFDEAEDLFAQRTNAVNIAKNFYDKSKLLYGDISLGIGNYYNHVKEGKRSYYEAVRALREVTNKDEASILHIDDLIEESNSVLDEEEIFETKIYQSASIGAVADTVRAFDEVFQYMNKSVMPDFEMLKNKMISLIVGLGRRFGSAIRNYYQVLNDIIAVENESLLYQLCRRYVEESVSLIASSKQKKINGLIKKANEYLENNYEKEISLEDIAKEVNLSPYYFSRFYKDETGVNFIDQLTNIRIERAKHYLVTTELSVKDVARNVGYGDPNYFSKLFKKITGQTATEYKEYYGR